MPSRSQKFTPEADALIVHHLSRELDTECRITGKGKFTGEVWQNVAAVLRDAGHDYHAKPVSGRFDRVRRISLSFWPLTDYHCQFDIAKVYN